MCTCTIGLALPSRRREPDAVIATKSLKRGSTRTNTAQAIQKINQFASKYNTSQVLVDNDSQYESPKTQSPSEKLTLNATPKHKQPGTLTYNGGGTSRVVGVVQYTPNWLGLNRARTKSSGKSPHVPVKLTNLRRATSNAIKTQRGSLSIHGNPKRGSLGPLDRCSFQQANGMQVFMIQQ
jgi:hypothetical protein